MSTKQLKDYIYKINENIKKDNLDITIVDRFRKTDKSKTKTYHIKCNICGFDSRKGIYKKGKFYPYSIEEYNLKNLANCPCCSSKLVQVGINNIPTTAPWMVKYFQNGYEEAKKYSRSSTKRLFFKCPDCNRIKHNKIAIQQLYKIGKISCICQDGMSLPEKIMYYLLLQSNDISKNFKYQYSPTWCQFYLGNTKKHGIYDFYFKIDDNEFLIEMDGNFHYEKHYKGKTVQLQKQIDHQKDILAKENGMKVVRIDCKRSDFEYVKNNILKSCLFTMLKLDDVDWEKIKENCYKNIIKLVCDDYKFGMHNTVKLAEKYHISRSSVISYLHIGNENKWCEYHGGNKKKVYQYTLDGEFVKCWDSCNEAIRKTGISSINACLINKIKQAGGYLWLYEKKVSDNNN